MKARPLGWLLAPVPLLVGGATGLAMTLAGDERVLQLSLALPGAAVAAGAVLTAAAVAPLAVSGARRRQRDRRVESLAEARQEGAVAEREQHRRFLARLDHELKNPIMAIRAQAAAAADPAPEWATVDAQAAKLGTVVQDLRKLAELETRPLDRESVDLEELVADCLAAVAQQHPAAAGRFALTVTRVPWPVPALSVDLDLLSLAVDNVLANAAKYSVDGPIEVRLREQDGSAVIEVADSGRGIPEQDVTTVFDELARAANARDVPGTGLGLTLVATVLRRHGGSVQLRSLENSGTVVTLRLPLP